ncbi:MAG TPA: HAD-IA family hydrolase [Syntrophales bacterium]|nr:HAD-IA family hydrolase [Syntrophales bacterium]HPN23508.1 HAD-IA family hydrolase [Syntrophales bacterium]
MKRIERQLKTVLFDFDGTLARLNIDFMEMRRSVLNLVSTYYGEPTDGLGDLFVLEMIGAAEALISRRRPGHGRAFREKALEMIARIEIEGAESGELFGDVRDMLGTLRERKISTGIVTRNCWNAVRVVFPDILSFCDAVVTREVVIWAKPHPDHILYALKVLDSAPEEAAMVGDHPMDIRTGKDVGAYTIGVLTGYSQADPLLKAGADLIIDRASSLVHYLP